MMIRTERPSPESAQRARLLLVEDDDIDAELVCRTLGRSRLLDLEVVRVRSLGEAVQWLGEERPFAVVSDLTLPDAKGVEAVVALRQVAPETCLIIQTGNDDPSVRADVLRMGADDCLGKGARAAEGLEHTLVARMSLRPCDVA